MACHRRFLLVLLACLGACAAPNRLPEPTIALFDGGELTHWQATGSVEWRSEDGDLVGGQDGDPKRSGIIMTRRAFGDFDLELEFKIDEHGKYNSGVYLRYKPTTHKWRTYQLNIGRAAAGEYTGLYLDDWLDKGDADDSIRKPNAWNRLRVRAVGPHIQAWLNGKPLVDYTDPAPKPHLLEPGRIALQTYGAEGHDGWVRFRNIRIRDLGGQP